MDETATHESTTEEAPPATASVQEGERPTKDQVLDALKHVIDPELGINIVDLGLVYEVEVTEQGAVHIDYTLTTMGCPIGPLIEHQMESFLVGMPGVSSVEPEMVLRPAWSPEMMSEEAKAALGYF
jgi:metal-sulfur cluster biosynthetic enzyme